MTRAIWRRHCLVGIAALVVLLTGCRVSGGSDGHTYEVTGRVNRLVVKAFGHVEVTAGDGAVRVTESMHSLGKRPSPSHQSDGGTLRLDAGCGGQALCEVDYTVRVPAAVAVEVSTVSGDVTIRNVSGDVKVDSKSGQVQGYGLASRNTTINASGGAVTLRYSAVPSTVDVHADAGKVTLQVPSGTRYAVDTKAVFGFTVVDVPVEPSSDHKIKVYARAGDIRINTDGQT